MTGNAKVVHVGETIRAGGGSFGYLHNLREGLRSHGAVGIEVVGLLDDSVARDSRSDRNGRLLRKIFAATPRIVRGVRAVRRLNRSDETLLQRFAGKIERLRDADAVVFHDPFLARQYLVAGRPPRQSIFIMPHAPTDLGSERFVSFRAQYGWGLPWSSLRRRWQRAEVEAYAAADALLAPCHAALDGYFLDNGSLRTRLDRLRVVEVLSGAPRLQVGRPAATVRASWDMCDDTIVFGYFGRYHEHKGFDLFAAAARQLTGSGARTAFVAVGAGPLRRASIAPLRDLGSVSHNDVGTLMNAVDAVVVPNRYTYFDLVILEAFSLGKAVITTAVGGAKCLQAYTQGVAFVPEASQTALCRALAAVDRATLVEMGERNARAYAEHFSIPRFVERHVALAETMTGGSPRSNVASAAAESAK